MIILKGDSNYAFDIDGTLISLKRYKPGTLGTIKIFNPYSKEYRFVKVHQPHVELMHEMLGRGRRIVVWSGSGVLWAYNVLKALGFKKNENIVVMTKLAAHVDDQDCTNWMGNRIFIPCEGLENE